MGKKKKPRYRNQSRQKLAFQKASLASKEEIKAVQDSETQPKLQPSKNTKQKLEIQQANSGSFKRIKTLLKTVWFWVTVVSVIIGLIIAYLSLRPKVSILYNAGIMPTNNLNLPVKVINNSYFSITNVRLESLDALQFTHDGKSEDNLVRLKFASEIKSGESKEYVIKKMFKFKNNPIKGYILITIFYDYTFLKLFYSQAQKFVLYLDKYGEVRWQAN
jgi:hypothetical protein